MPKSLQRTLKGWRKLDIYAVIPHSTHIYCPKTCRHSHKTETYTSNSFRAGPRQKRPVKLKCLEAKTERPVCSCERIPAVMLSAGKRLTWKMSNKDDEPVAVWLWSGKIWPMMNVCDRVCVWDQGKKIRLCVNLTEHHSSQSIKVKPLKPDLQSNEKPLCSGFVFGLQTF